MSPRIDALLRRGAAARGHRHRLGRRGAGAREPPDQAAQPALQHPAARRQELPLPAADDRRGVPARARRPAASSATATTTPGRSCRRRSARRTMALTHRLFGIRSCNEVITGERGRPCLEYDIKRCIAPCVRDICSHRASTATAVEHTRLFLEGRNDELRRRRSRGRMTEAADGRALRAGGATARRHPHDRNAAARGSRRWRAPSSATATRSA